MKYIHLFEQFKYGHKFDLLDLFTITPEEVKELFFKEMHKGNSDLENIQVFLDSGLIDPNVKNTWGWTALYLAAWSNSLEIAKLLISYGANPNAKDQKNVTPLHIASEYNSLDVAKLLISSGADLKAKSYWANTPLDLAKSQEMEELLTQKEDVL